MRHLLRAASALLFCAFGAAGGPHPAAAQGVSSAVTYNDCSNDSRYGGRTGFSLLPTQNIHGQLCTAQTSSSGTAADVRATGTLALQTLNATYAVALNNGEATTAFQVTNLTGSAATLISEGSRDGGTTWSTHTCNAALVSTYTADGGIRCNTAGLTNIRLRVSVAGATQNATVASNASSATGLVELSQPARPTNSAGAYSAATVGTSDSTILAAATSPVFLDLVNNSSTATVCINMGATATISGSQPYCAAGELTLPPLYHRSWEGSYVPSDAVHAIATGASTPFAVGAK